MPPTATKLVIVGTGDGLARLQSLATDLGVAQHVVFAGWVDHPHVPAYLAAADVAVYPYRDTPDQPRQVLDQDSGVHGHGQGHRHPSCWTECGVPRTPPIGILVEPGNQDEFVQGMITCLSDREFARKLGLRPPAASSSRTTGHIASQMWNVRTGWPTLLPARPGQGRPSPVPFI